MRGLLAVLLLCIFCSVAFAEGSQEVMGVEWYKTHPEERKMMLARCNDNPGELRNDPNCINAKRAALTLSGGSVRRPAPSEQPKGQ